MNVKEILARKKKPGKIVVLKKEDRKPYNFSFSTGDIRLFNLVRAVHALLEEQDDLFCPGDEVHMVDDDFVEGESEGERERFNVETTIIRVERDGRGDVSYMLDDCEQQEMHDESIEDAV